MNFFSILTSEMESESTLPACAMFHPHTTEMHPFKVKYFLRKTLKFQHDGVIIYDVSRDFRNLFGMWN